MKPIRNISISLFVILWLALFNYESLRAMYLNPIAGFNLPKTRLLFPPAGWIMFYEVSPMDGYVEVSGFRNTKEYPIDPHEIFEDRWLGYDNIRRNVMATVLHPLYRKSFCRYLRRKFTVFEWFLVRRVIYPSPTEFPGRSYSETMYRCAETDPS